MYIEVITPLGTFKSNKNEEVSLEELQVFLEKTISQSDYLTIFTLLGPVILGTDILRNSAIKIRS